MTNRRILQAALLGAACAIGVLWATEIPLGIPGEWTWERISLSRDQLTDAGLGALIAVAVGLCYLAVAAFGARRLAGSPRWEIVIWLFLLVAAGFCWLLAVQEAPPDRFGMTKTPWAIYYRGASGYYFEARYEMAGPSAFLEAYPERISTAGDERYLHVGTHPPGLFLFYRGIISLCERSPRLAEALRTWQPSSVAAGLRTIEQTSLGSRTPLLPVDHAAIWLTAVVTQLFGAATLVPIYVLVRRDFSRETAWRAACFWPLVPALAIFLPGSDVFHPFLGMSFLALWLVGRERRSILLCVLSGFVFWLGMFFSLAILPYALLAAFLTVWEICRCDADPRPAGVVQSLVSVAWSLVGFFTPVLVLATLFHLNLVQVWSTNLRNHAEFYAHYPRTYWKWLVENPVELSFALGFPLALLAAVGLCFSLQHGIAKARLTGVALGCAVVSGLLWLSGKNMGEAARLWLIIQPWAIWLAAGVLMSAQNRNDANESAPRGGGIGLSNSVWLGLLATQTLVSLATVMRVTGFNFTGG